MDVENNLKDDNFENIVIDDIAKMYLNEIKKYPVLSSDELINLIEQYQKGNADVREKIINSNLRLVVSIAARYLSFTTSFTFLDLIQEGNIGLMRAVETYDKEQGAFSTYATFWIKQSITSGINFADKSIRRPDYIVYISIKYKKLIAEYYKKYNKLPEDNYIKESLKITDETLKYLKNESNYDVLSFDKKVNSDDPESNELLDFIPSLNNDYDDFLNDIETFEYFTVIKSLLSSKEYYVLYYRILSDEKKSLEYIGNSLNITRERARQLEKKALKKVTPYIQKDSRIYLNRLDKVKKRYGNMYNLLKLEPLTPNDICLYLYLKDELSDVEQKLLYLKVIDQYNYQEDNIKEILDLDDYAYTIINNKLSTLINNKLKDSSKFNELKNKIIKENGSKIYNLKLIDEDEIINYNFLKNKYFNITFDELKKIFGENLINLTNQEINIIKKYYQKKEGKNISIDFINREMNLLLHGYKEYKNSIGLNNLYKVFLKNKDCFSKEQILFLESYIFNLKSPKEFKNAYPNSYLPREKYLLVEKLEMIYYGINKTFEINFNLEKYLDIKKFYSDKLGKQRIEILDLYYIDKKSIKEIALIYGVTYLKMHGMLRDAREYANNLYVGRSSTIKIDKTKYHKYILDPRFSLTEESRNILKLFMIENKTYDEISKITSLSKTRISNIITESIRKMDNYRFNLLIFDEYTLEMLEKFYLVYGNHFDKKEIDIIKDRYIIGLENKDIASKYNVSLNAVNRIIAKFNRLYFLYQIKDVKITSEEIKEEINKSLIESVITEREKEVLSYYYGIKNIYNQIGLKLNSSSICEKLNITKNVCYHVLKLSEEKIKGRKIDIIKPELLYMDRNELIEMLKDEHLPISLKEREIIYYLFGLWGFKTKTIDEISQIYNDTPSSIKRRYMRAIVSILKYKNKEIDGNINYDIDILPNLKYFPNNYQILLQEYYKNNMTYEKLAKKYKLTTNQIISIFDRIKIELFEMINNPSDKKFDFDFYEKNRNNHELPFYGNNELVDQIFRLYFGMDDIKRVPVPEIITKLNLSNEVTSVHKMISNYMLSICKLQDGIKKVEEFDLETIKNYYSKHKNEMSNISKLSYESYFSRIEKSPYFYYKKTNINDIIINDMLNEKYDNCFDINNLSREQMIRILKKYNKKIDINIKNELMSLFDITEKEFMTGKEINHLYRILNKLDNKLTLEKGKILKI